jgi:hypothetical protein
MFRLHHDGEAREELTLDLDEIARAGARRMLAHALEAEVDSYIEAAKKTSATKMAMPWSFAMGTLRSVRSSVGPEP